MSQKSTDILKFMILSLEHLRKYFLVKCILFYTVLMLKFFKLILDLSNEFKA